MTNVLHLSRTLATAIVAALAGATFLAQKAVGQQYTGDATAYGDSWEGGNCLYQDLPLQAKTSFVAMNQVLWDSLGLQHVCGRCVRMTYGSNTVLGMITNRCPECAISALDLADDLYLRLTGSSPNRLTISWEIVDCNEAEMGVTGDVSFYVKDGTNANWLAVHPTNFLKPIVKMEVEYPIGGSRTELRFGDSGLNYYIGSGLNLAGEYRLHATDENGKVFSSGVVSGVTPSTFIKTTTSNAAAAPQEAMGASDQEKDEESSDSPIITTSAPTPSRPEQTEEPATTTPHPSSPPAQDITSSTPTTTSSSSSQSTVAPTTTAAAGSGEIDDGSEAVVTTQAPTSSTVTRTRKPCRIRKMSDPEWNQGIPTVSTAAVRSTIIQEGSSDDDATTTTNPASSPVIAEEAQSSLPTSSAGDDDTSSAPTTSSASSSASSVVLTIPLLLALISAAVSVYSCAVDPHHQW